MKNKNYIYFAIGLVIAFFAGRFASPKEVEIQETEKVVYRDKIIKDDKKHIRVETRETILPDGTKIVETIKDRKTETKTDSERNLQSDKSKEILVKNQSQWGLGLYVIVYGRENSVYTLIVDRRILGGLFAGAYGRSSLEQPKPEFGLGLRLEF